MLKIVSHMGNANQNYRDATLYSLEWLKLKWLTIPNAGEDAELLTLSYIAGMSVKWNNQYRNLSGRSLLNTCSFLLGSNTGLLNDLETLLSDIYPK